MGFLGLVLFSLGVAVLFFSLPLAGLTTRLKFWKPENRNDMFDWGLLLTNAFGIKVVRRGPNKLYRGPKCIYLCNHRSWCDFFLDAVLTDGRAAVLARCMVLVAFFLSLTYAWLGNYIFVFNRTAVKDKEKFNVWLDKRMQEGPLPGLIVYPEGHRNLKKESLPLRRGMLKYSYSRRYPVQIVITKGKEEAFNESKMCFSYGKTLVTGFSEVIEASKFKTFEDFVEELQLVWDELWARVYSPEASDLEPFLFERREKYRIETSKHITLFAWMVLSNTVLLCTVGYVASFGLATVRRFV